MPIDHWHHSIKHALRNKARLAECLTHFRNWPLMFAWPLLRTLPVHCFSPGMLMVTLRQQQVRSNIQGSRADASSIHLEVVLSKANGSHG